jgi:hypothetical protein
MLYRKLDSNDDYSFGQGKLNFYQDIPIAVAQAVKTRLRLWLSEWFLDITEGMPWIDGVLGKAGKESSDLAIREHILETQGVLEIIEYNSSINVDERIFKVDVEIDTIYGPIKINEVL